MKLRLAAWVLCLLPAWTLLASDVDRARAHFYRAEYNQVVEILKTSPEARTADGLLLLGRAYYQLGDYKKATEALEKASLLRPGDATIWLWLGRAWGRRAETSNMFTAPSYASKARQCFEKAVELDPSNKEALNDLFTYYLEAPGFLGGGFEKAQALVARIHSLDPAEGEFALAQLAEKQKEYDRAEAHLRRAVELAPRQVGRVLDLARFFARRGRVQEAERTLEEAEQLAPGSPKVLYARAEFYILTRRNPQEARRLLEQYLRSSLTPEDPSPEQAKKLLQRIGG